MTPDKGEALPIFSGDLPRRRFVQGAMTAGVAAAFAPWGRLALGSATSERQPTDRSPIDLVVEETPVRIAGRDGVATLVNGSLPGPVIRLREGEEAVIRVANRLSESTSIHWHGVLLPTNMDGVPGVSYAGIDPGEVFTYRYTVGQSGTYWYHSHTGLQEQLGHYGALIIDPAEPEPFQYDREYVVILSDWMFESPYAVLKKLKKFPGYFNYQRPTVANLMNQARRIGLGNAVTRRLRWRAMRMDPTDIADITGVIYTYLMNGRAPNENWTAVARPGEVVRLRIINAATMTYFDFRIPGLPLTVVAADGQNVKPVETDEIRIAVAETYDVLVTMPDDRAHTMFAETMDRSGYARGTLAPREGMEAPLPARRPRAMRTMADVGMAGMAGMGMSDMGGMDGGMGGMSGTSDSPMQMSGSHEPGPTGDPAEPAMSHQQNSTADMHNGGLLPTEHLPDSVVHGPEHQGAGTSMIAKMPRRRFAEPGIGLGDDGWRVLTYADLRALHRPRNRRAPQRQFDLHLTGNMDRYIWGFDGKKFSEVGPIPFVYGERLRINMINDTMMDHPIHLHGMWMDLYAGGTLDDNPRKHTVSVKPGELLTVDITADAPGRWAFHCHLLFHMDMGMFRTVAVVRSLSEMVKT